MASPAEPLQATQTLVEAAQALAASSVGSDVGPELDKSTVGEVVEDISRN